MACNYQGAPDAKKPCKGILKTSSSFDKHSLANNRKSAKFDEINVLQTYHPADKDYGHMKIEEPKTPYRIAEGDDDLDSSYNQMDPELLAEKLRKVTSRSSVEEEDDSTDEEETEDSRMKRLEFEKRRKAHYNEFDAVRRARQLMEEEGDDDEDNSNVNIDNNMEVDETNPRQSTSGGASGSRSTASTSSTATFAAVDV